jgi:hypothetical protein
LEKKEKERIKMTTIEDLKTEIQKIKERNKRVEIDKSWELSKSRKLLIAIATYFVISLFLLVSRIPDPWLNALIPTLAFLISTLTLPIFKNLWISFIYRKS